MMMSLMTSHSQGPRKNPWILQWKPQLIAYKQKRKIDTEEISSLAECSKHNSRLCLADNTQSLNLGKLFSLVHHYCPSSAEGAPMERPKRHLDSQNNVFVLEDSKGNATDSCRQNKCTEMLVITEDNGEGV